VEGKPSRCILGVPMTHVYVPSSVHLTSLTEPIDGEPRTVASVTQVTRALADGVVYAVATSAASVAAETARATGAEDVLAARVAMLGVTQTNLPSQKVTTSTSYVTVDNFHTSLTCNVGDYIMVDMVWYTTVAAAFTGYCKPWIIANTTDFDPGLESAVITDYPTTITARTTCSFYWVVTNAGTVTAYTKYKGAASGFAMNAGSTIRMIRFGL